MATAIIKRVAPGNIQSNLKVELDFSMQHQQEMAWCWAAVGTSCSLYYHPKKKWTQCKLAYCSLEPKPKKKCCKCPGSRECNKIWYLEDSTEQKGSFITTKIANGFTKGAIPFARLVSELNLGRLVAYRMQLQMEGHTMFHFVVIAGYDLIRGNQDVTIFDPYFGGAIMEYQEFIHHYKYNGFVTHTFFTKPRQSKKKP